MNALSRVSALCFLVWGAVSLCTGCSQQQQQPVPRPKAFFRIVTPDSVYTSLQLNGLDMSVSAQARISQGQNGGADIAYPSLKAVIYLSVNHFDGEEALMSAIANRNQRIALNLGGNTSRTDNFTNAAQFRCTLVRNLGTTGVPLQFTAAGPANTLVSGAAVFATPATNADSIAPAVEALQRDIMQLLLTLQPVE